MFDSLIDSVEKTFLQPSLRRFLFLLFLLVLMVSGFLAFNRMTGYTTYSRIERKLTILERLHELERSGINNSDNLATTYDQLVATIQTDRPTFTIPDFGIPSLEPIWKFLAGSLVGLLFIIWGVIKMVRGDREGARLAGGAIIFSLLLGIPALAVPTIHSMPLTIAILGLVQLGALTLLTRYNQRQGEARHGA